MNENVNEKTLSIMDIIYSLLGDVKPIGSTEYDGKMFKNLQKHKDIIDWLVNDISIIAVNKLTGRQSEDKVIKNARRFMFDLSSQLQNTCGDIHVSSLCEDVDPTQEAKK